MLNQQTWIFRLKQLNSRIGNIVHRLRQSKIFLPYLLLYFSSQNFHAEFSWMMHFSEERKTELRGYGVHVCSKFHHLYFVRDHELFFLLFPSFCSSYFSAFFFLTADDHLVFMLCFISLLPQIFSGDSTADMHTWKATMKLTTDRKIVAIWYVMLLCTIEGSCVIGLPLIHVL